MIFVDLFNNLIDAAQSEDLKEEIRFFRDRLSDQEAHPAPQEGEKFHPVYSHAFTAIANMALDFNETHVCQTAREMRDEIEQYMEKQNDHIR